MRAQDSDAPARSADIIAVPLLFGFVLIVNVILILPLGTVTVEGRVAQDSLLDTFIVSPPMGAAEVMVIVPELSFPAVTVAGVALSDAKDGALRVMEVVFETPALVAVRMTVL